MIPHERSLVEALKGRSFVLLGVNSDKDQDDVKGKMVTYEINWRSWKNIREQGEPVASGFKVQAWPCVFLIDHKGVLRQKWFGLPDESIMNQTVEALVKEAEAK